MEPSGFDYVARQVPLYRDLLLSLPQWVKEQAFDFHFSAGQPISLCGREGICFLVGRGCVSRCPQDAPPVTSQQIRELFLQICGYSVYAHEDELRQGYVRLGEGCRVGSAARLLWREAWCAVCGMSLLWSSASPAEDGAVRTGSLQEASLWRRGSWWLARLPVERPPSCGI